MADMTENKAAVGKYSSSVNDAALAGLAKTYALVLSKKDTQYVACSDAKERDTVRANFLQKKLGLTNAAAELDAAVLALPATAVSVAGTPDAVVDVRVVLGPDVATP